MDSCKEAGKFSEKKEESPLTKAEDTENKPGKHDMKHYADGNGLELFFTYSSLFLQMM